MLAVPQQREEGSLLWRILKCSKSHESSCCAETRAGNRPTAPGSELPATPRPPRRVPSTRAAGQGLPPAREGGH